MQPVREKQLITRLVLIVPWHYSIIINMDHFNRLQLLDLAIRGLYGAMIGGFWRLIFGTVWNLICRSQIAIFLQRVNNGE
jgi:hypothetical protein